MSLARLAEALPSVQSAPSSYQPYHQHATVRESTHKLQAVWQFWYMRRQGPRSQESYEQSIKPLGPAFDTVCLPLPRSQTLT